MNTFTQSLFRRIGLGLVAGVAYSLVRDQLRYRSLKNAVAVVSGGSRGLGLVTAKELAYEGANLALLARDKDELERAKKIVEMAIPKCEVIILECDVTKPHQVDQAIGEVMNHFGKIDVVVNNAGIISSAPFENVTKKDYEDSLDVHFWAPFYVNRACLNYMTRGARIVNISSIGGLIPVPHRAAYCTGKFALTGYSESLRADLMSRGIYVTTVCPGLMRTGSSRHALFKGQVKKEYAWFSLIASMPLLTVSAEKAARRIVSALKVGKAETTISMSARMASMFHSHFPGIFADISAVANLLLPGPTADTQRSVEGKDAQSFISPSVLTSLGDRAAERNNEIPPQSDQLH
ncbi:SDR family NAD(P)-dependent oxidoreductase [Bdellovibrio sp. HCB209]|uniref:SDR family NAD(P)-dependent oxidoreductase n=1 Tax=Bdellovibrio sp. HCB209 TaxID=3394354 RepID=UPI0039B431A3